MFGDIEQAAEVARQTPNGPTIILIPVVTCELSTKVIVNFWNS
ncbi:hypothetical protein [Paenibacillus mucilaginosus]